jgi:hypothetical protein
VSTFPDQLGIIGVGHGEVVLPAPTIESAWNTLFRGYADGVFKWGLVTGLQPDPDLGYMFTEAASYRLEMTPDLGLGNEEVLFDPYLGGDQGNSRLIVVKNLVVGEDLISGGDGTVTFEVPVATMKRLLAPGFDRYLWRVRAVSATGVVGHPSLIQRFRGRVAVSHLGWTVENPPSPSRTVTAVLRGKREPSISSIEVNGVSGWTTFPSPTTWQADVPLTPGRNLLFLRAFDSQGNGGEYRHVEVEFTANEVQRETFFNRFDDFGYQLSLARLPGERNLSFRERIKDVLVHRASPTYAGIMNAIGRELDLTYYDQALLIEAADAPEGSRYRDVVVWLGARHFFVKRSNVQALEYHVVEGRTWQVRPDHYAEGEPFIVERSPGSVVSPDAYHVLRDTDGPYIQFIDPSFAGQEVYITYGYAERVDIVGKTVEEVVDELNALEFDGRPAVVVTIDGDLPEDARAEGLQHFPPTPVGFDAYRTAGGQDVEQVPVRWMPAELDAFCDQDFKWRHTNENGTQFGTEYEGWAERLRAKLKTTWGYLVADEACWSAPWLRTSGIGSLDTIYDPYPGSWMTTRGDRVYRIHPSVAVFRNIQDPRDGSRLVYEGLPWEWNCGGIGWGYCLFAYIDEDAVIFGSEEEGFTIVRQTESGELPDFEDLGFGVDGVDSGSEVGA